MTPFLAHLFHRRQWLTFLLSTVLLLLFFPAAHGADLKVLVSGFEPFGGYSTNPSQALVRYIQSGTAGKIPGVHLRSVTLPVTYFGSWESLLAEIEAYDPDYVLSFGFDAGSRGIQIESIARNYDSGYRDNKGATHSGPIVNDGPGQYDNELPVAAIANRLKSRGIPVSVSSDAGGYICNHIFYQARHFSQNRPELRTGFFHVPDWPVEGEAGTWSVLKEILLLLYAGEM